MPPHPTEPRSIASAFRKRSSAVADDRKQDSAVRSNRARIASLAEQQFGLAKWSQLRRRGVAEAAIARALDTGRLVEVHPGVYSTVPLSLMSVEAWHGAAILAGGAGACLCCESAGWWASLLKAQPPKIHVAICCDLEELPGVVWHRLALREGERDLHRGLPITAPVRIPLDLASRLSLWELKGVLAELEFHHGIGPEVVARTLRRGYTGSAKLRRALAEHTPELALTRSELERMFTRFLSDRGFELPSFNAAVGLSTVDATYETERVVIELDGVKGHSGQRRVLRDHRRDAHHRASGYAILRYHYAQLVHPADQRMIEAELDRLGIPREPCW
jgi:very-short-patch-repair endonuclease